MHAPQVRASVDPTVSPATAHWQDYALTGDPEALLLHYRDLVDQVAGRLARDLPAFVDRADLAAYGVFGLIDAVRKFDPARGVKFEAYATLRIRGAVLDGLRADDWVPRSVRARVRDVARTECRLQMRLHRPPTEDEMVVATGITADALRRASADATLSTVVPLDDARYAGVRDRAEWVADRSREDGQPGHALEAAERRRAIAGALAGLCDRDRTVIDLYYFRGLKLTEIGRVLGVTEARVSQLCTRARSALKESLLAVDY